MFGIGFVCWEVMFGYWIVCLLVCLVVFFVVFVGFFYLGCRGVWVFKLWVGYGGCGLGLVGGVGEGFVCGGWCGVVIVLGLLVFRCWESEVEDLVNLFICFVNFFNWVG